MEHSITHVVTHFVLQLAVILFAAKVSGLFFERVLKLPSVLGELVIGMGIGPYALGHMIHVPGMGALFELPHTFEQTNIPVSVELWAFAQVAVVVLLFLAGLETDLKQFLRYGFPATVVALGGVFFPFVVKG